VSKVLSSRRLRKTGWIFFSLAWIPFIGIFVGMAGMPEGSYDWTELPLLTRVSMASAGGLMGVATALMIGSMIYRAMRNRSVLAHGRSAEATIAQIEPTGQTVNDYLVGMSFLLDVKPSTQPPFRARTEKLVPMHMIAQYPLGGVVKVKFDPRTKAVALVDESPAEARSSARPGRGLDTR
jgi:hypothetical protein